MRLLNNSFFSIANRYRREHLETLYGGAKRPVIRCLLDTNVLYSILELHDNPSNDAANALLTTIERAKKYIDVRLYVFPPTVDELKRSLIAHEEFLSQLIVSKSLHAAVSDGAVSGVVFKFLTESARTGYTLSVKDYFDPYHNNLTQILRDKGIQLFNEKTDNYANDQRTIDDALDQQSFLTQKHLNRNPTFHDVLLWYENAHSNCNYANDQRTIDDALDQQSFLTQLVQVDCLILERAPEAFDEDVVHAPAPAVHGDRDTRVFEDTGEAEAGELAALVGVEDLRPAVSG